MIIMIIIKKKLIEKKIYIYFFFTFLYIYIFFLKKNE